MCGTTSQTSLCIISQGLLLRNKALVFFSRDQLSTVRSMHYYVLIITNVPNIVECCLFKLLLDYNLYCIKKYFLNVWFIDMYFSVCSHSAAVKADTSRVTPAYSRNCIYPVWFFLLTSGWLYTCLILTERHHAPLWRIHTINHGCASWWFCWFPIVVCFLDEGCAVIISHFIRA